MAGICFLAVSKVCGSRVKASGMGQVRSNDRVQIDVGDGKSFDPTTDGLNNHCLASLERYI